MDLKKNHMKRIEKVAMVILRCLSDPARCARRAAALATLYEAARPRDLYRGHNGSDFKLKNTGDISAWALIALKGHLLTSAPTVIIG